MARRPSHLERNWDTLLNAYLDVAHDADGTVRIPADYIVYADSTVGYRARAMSAGTSFTHATDAASVVQSAVTALGTSGGTIVLAGNLAWGSVPALPRSITSKLRILGANARVTLSSAGPRLFDFNKVADHDTFQNIEIADITVDVNSVGGQHHIILGTYISGTVTTRINVQDVTIRRVKWINAPVDPTLTNHRLGVWIVVSQGASEGTQNTLQRILLEDVQGFGGNNGAVVGGTGGSGQAPDVNVVFDEIVFHRCRHSFLAVAGSSGSASNFQIGSRAKGGPIGSRIEGCYGEYSSDVGIEVDSGSVAIVDCAVRDSRNANFFITNFNTPVSDVSGQKISFERCKSIMIESTTCKAYSIRTAGMTTAVPVPPKIVLDNCTALKKTGATTSVTGWALYRDDNSVTPAGTFTTHLIVKDFHFEEVIDGTATYSAGPIQIGPTAGALNMVDFDGVSGNVGGAYSTGSMTWTGLYLIGTNMRYNVRRVRLDFSGANFPANSFKIIDLGLTSGTTLSGHNILRDVSFGSVSGGTTNPFGIIVRGTGTLTINGTIAIEGCDMSPLTAFGSGTDYTLDSTQLGKVFPRGNKYRTAPAPTTLTSLVTATGKALGTKFDAMATFTQGSGAAITAIDYSTNGGSTYTNFLTQSSGALPAGFDQSLGPLPPDALIKVTFATTQPTITLVPVNP